MDDLQQYKILKLEEYLDRLKPNLKNAVAQRDKIFEQQNIFSDLRRNIENLQKECGDITTLHGESWGQKFTCKRIEDTRHIFVDIGLGFHVEFTWSEALDFIRVREARLGRQIEEYTQLIASIKAQIKMVGEGIRVLHQLAPEYSH